MATPPTMPVAPPIAAPRAAPGPPPAAAPMAAPEAAPITPPPRPRCTGSYGFVQADRPNTNAAMTHGTVRVTIVSVRSSTGPNRQRQRIHRTVSLNSSSVSALRPEGRAALGLENLWPGMCVPISLRQWYGSPPGFRMVYRPSDLLPGSAHLGRGRPDVHPCRKGMPALAFSFTMIPGTDDPFGPCGWEHRFGHGTRRT